MQPLFRRLLLAAGCAWATEAYAQFGQSHGSRSSYYAARDVDRRGDEDATQPYVVMSAQQKQDFEAGIAALRRPVRGDFDEVPLTDAIQRLQKESGCRFGLDEQSLADAAIGGDTLITLNLGVAPLRTVLDRMLGNHALAWAPTSPGLLVTTQEQVDTNPKFQVVVLHPVYDLVVARNAGKDEFDFDSLIDAIVSTVRMETWRETGTGEGSIVAVSSTASLMVTQHWIVQEELSALLQGMRMVKARQGLGTLQVVRRLRSSGSILDDDADRYSYRPQNRRRQRTYLGIERPAMPPPTPAPRSTTSGSSGGFF
jgi:hypothetical protein